MNSVTIVSLVTLWARVDRSDYVAPASAMTTLTRTLLEIVTATLESVSSASTTLLVSSVTAVRRVTMEMPLHQTLLTSANVNVLLYSLTPHFSCLLAVSALC